MNRGKVGVDRRRRVYVLGYLRARQHLMLLLLGAGFSLLISVTVGSGAGLVALSLVHVWLGLSIFLTHGGIFVTPSGLYFLAAAVLVGIAGAFGAAISWFDDPSPALRVSLAILLGHVVMLILGPTEWLRSGPVR